MIWCFDSIHAITSNVSPVAQSSGLQVLETDSVRLQCFQTPTGTKFVLIAEKSMLHLDTMLQTVYELYADYVLKNPFYQLEQPIKCDQFDSAVEKLLKH